MPLPLILAGLAAGVASTRLHSNAKRKNERAQELLMEAQEMYDYGVSSLNSAKWRTESALTSLGNTKKKTLEGSVRTFLRAQNRIKQTTLRLTDNMNEAAKLSISSAEIQQLQDMSDRCQKMFSLGAAGAGATTGAVMALAASGTLPIVTGVFSTAGTALALGQVGAAASIAGTGLSMAASMTPLAAIAAPVLLFTGFSSNIKADERLEKAQVQHSRAVRAVEEMRVSETLCEAIRTKANMFEQLITKLDGLFSYCADTYDMVTARRKKLYPGRLIPFDHFTQEEMKLMYVTGALAKTIKTLIDTPILDQNGNIDLNASQVYSAALEGLPSNESAVEQLKDCDYETLPLTRPSDDDSQEGSGIVGWLISRNLHVLLGVVSCVLTVIFISKTVLAGLLAFTLPTLFTMRVDPTSVFLTKARKLLFFALAIELSALFWIVCMRAYPHHSHIFYDIIAGIVATILLGYGYRDNISPARKLFCSICSCIFFFAVGGLLFALLYGLFGFPLVLTTVLLTIVYFFFSWVGLRD